MVGIEGGGKEGLNLGENGGEKQEVMLKTP